MLYDYDLVVIGDSLAGRWAALSAAKQYARVAWVQQNQPSRIGLTQTYQELCHGWSSSLWLKQGVPFTCLRDVHDWIETHQKQVSQSYSFHKLAEAGVDVIQAQGKFLDNKKKKKTTPIFEVRQRQLRSGRFLLALGTDQELSNTPHSLMRTLALNIQREEERSSISLTNNGWETLLTAQILNAFNQTASLVNVGKILEHEDADVCFWIQNQLEAQGIQVRLPTEAKKVFSEEKRHPQETTLHLE